MARRRSGMRDTNNDDEDSFSAEEKVYKTLVPLVNSIFNQKYQGNKYLVQGRMIKESTHTYRKTTFRRKKEQNVQNSYMEKHFKDRMDN
ncbi:hypothetical protein TNCT_265951 [Trichonephila clavata]|uniref:Uncharacterized protein n=1 Tax=Trichonephila clavata TaxID=2740835 RepID=A0A8X6FV02_TRICU|nr:hypothetical protein TNCT_265951 [Trichonephila clavata]